MPSSFRTLRFSWQPLIASTIVLTGLTAAHHRVAPAQQDAPSEPSGADQLWVAYARACLELAEVELAEAREQNRVSKQSVTDYDVQRLQLHVRSAQQNLYSAERGVDAGQALTRQIEMQARLAELDFKNAEKLHREHPPAITDLRLERLRLYSEVCRSRLALIQGAGDALNAVDHLHWETHRLSEEVLLLNRRVEQLEETVLR